MPSPLEAADFSGGMVDAYISAPSNFFREADNFYISEDKKLFTRPSLKLYNPDFPRVPTLARIAKQFISNDTFITLSDYRAFYYSETTGFKEIFSPSLNRVFDTATIDSKFTVTKHNQHHYITSDAFSSLMSLTRDGSTWLARQVGLPTPDVSAMTLTSSGVGGPYSYIIQYKLTYSVDGVFYEELSPISDIQTINNDLTITLDNIPVLANDAMTNYDVLNVTKKIYRTTAFSNIFYLIDEIPNTTTTYVDTIADDIAEEAFDIVDILNIAGDITTTPTAKFVHQTNDILWLAQPKVDGVVQKSKLRQCVRFQPYNSPGDFEEDFEGEITGLSSINVYPIVFTKTSVFRIEGYYLANGAGGMTKRRISDTVGCVSNESIIQTNDGLFWAAETGWYFTNGFEVRRISNLINTTYRKYVQTDVQKGNIVGCYDQLNDRLLWTVQTDVNGTYADRIFVCHLRFGMSDKMPFTTWSGGKIDGQNFRPASLIYNNDNLYVGDQRGYFLNFAESTTSSDDRIDPSVVVDEWLESTIMYRYVSPSYDFGTQSMRKWVTWLILNLDNATSVSLQASFANDNSALFKNLATILYKSNIAWEDSDIEWDGDDQNIRWDYTPTLTTKRRVPSANRCTYKQLMLENAFAKLDSSTRVGQVTIDSTAKTATLTGAEDYPEDVVDYYVRMQIGDLVKDFKIAERTSDKVLLLSDDGDELVDGVYDFEIRGYRRGEILKLIEYSIIYQMTSMSQEPHSGEAS